MVEQENKNKSKQLPPQEEEVKIMAKPIEATPILKGKDLVELVKDLKRPDTNKARREKALKVLVSYTKGK
ncbi:hypothetical protein SY88_02590 [Clostridiales bacterium PH28_bin88]|nr:hypothetical protein SY88_02590 [Clostridiales bacterium PH28_bin88]